MLDELLKHSWLAGVLLAGAGAPVWVFLAQYVPDRLARAWVNEGEDEGEDERVPVVLCRAGRGLDLILIVLWSVVCLLAMQSWGVSKFGLAAVLFCGGLLTLARIDLSTGLLPDMLTLPLLWTGMLFHLSGGWISLADSVAGAASGYGLLWLIFTVYKWKTGREAMGYGDFKLAAALGAWLGWMALPVLFLYASLAGAVVGLLLQRYRRLSASSAIPFGPFLAVAGILILFSDYAPWAGGW